MMWYKTPTLHWPYQPYQYLLLITRGIGMSNQRNAYEENAPYNG